MVALLAVWPSTGRSGLAIHFFILSSSSAFVSTAFCRVGEDLWCEIDGMSGAEEVPPPQYLRREGDVSLQEPEADFRNTINGGRSGWWGWGRGPAGEHRGDMARYCTGGKSWSGSSPSPNFLYHWELARSVRC